MCNFGDGGGVVISKTYTYEVIKEGVIRGSGITRGTIFTSAMQAYNEAKANLESGFYIVNFRRIK